MPAFEPIVFNSKKKEKKTTQKNTEDNKEIKAYLMMLEDIILHKLSELNNK